MTKKTLNQNAKNAQKLIQTIEPDFIFSNKTINRFKLAEKINENKTEKLLELKKKINSIQNCNLKKNSKCIILGDGNILSPIMIVGEAPGLEEEKNEKTFQGESGLLLKKMLLAINVKKQDIYSTYAINFRPPEDRKPTAQEVKRYSVFLKEHVSIIDPKILVLFGSTALDSITTSKLKISEERGKFKEIILKNKTYPFIATFSPSYVIRFPENKKYSWEDLKKIRQKMQELKIQI